MRKNLYLATPGPVNIPEAVFQAMHCSMHHRIADFIEIFSRCRQNLPQFFQSDGSVLMMGSSGTGAMEASLINMLSPGDKVLVIESGKFGIRFAEIAETFGCRPIVVSSPYGTYPDPDEVQKALRENPDVKVVTACHSETSTGVLAPIADYAAAVAQTDALFIVDAISSAGCIPIDQTKNKIDICISSGQKGFMTPPGVSFISLQGEKFMPALKKSRLPKFYFDILRQLDQQQSCRPEWTPATHMIMALDQALAMMMEEGLENIYLRHKQVADYARKRGQELGFELFAHKGFTPSDSVSAFVTAKRIPTDQLIECLSQKNIIIAGGQDNLKGKIIRIGHLGMMDLKQIEWIFDEIERCLS